MPLTRDEDIYALLAETRTIAMIGASDRPDRPSYGVMAYLQSRGYRVLPVNPQITGEHVHGEYVWRELAQIGEPIDMVDIFRRPLAAGEAVDEAIAAGAKSVWLQIGVINEEAAARAEAAGLKVVMNRCPKIEIPRLGVPKVGLGPQPFEGDRGIAAIGASAEPGVAELLGDPDRGDRCRHGSGRRCAGSRTGLRSIPARSRRPRWRSPAPAPSGRSPSPPRGHRRIPAPAGA